MEVFEKYGFGANLSHSNALEFTRLQDHEFTTT